MQFYRDGYRPGDPDTAQPASTGGSPYQHTSSDVDVLIVGTGPAGTLLAAQLAAFPEIRTQIVERREGPLQVGRADGVACRTVETFQAFGLAEALLREAYWVNEVRFWGPSDCDRTRIARTGWVEDTPKGLSEFPHVIVNQARMQHYLLDHMAKSASRLEPDYGIEFLSYTIGVGEFPVESTLRHMTGSRADDEFVVRSKYVVGCDGARSGVRRAMGLDLRGDTANHAWGVMDVLAVTDFPDWRTKNVVQSSGKGSLLMIPREGGNMVRIYVDLGDIPAGDTSVRLTTTDQLTTVVNDILHPYRIDVRSVAWSSVYEVGQRLTDRFDDVAPDAGRDRTPKVFIAGDACHTHSAKAGQGMNVSMQDAFNLGWKLAAVLTHRSRESLLHTYTDERHRIAQDLIDFDKRWSTFIAQNTLDPNDPASGGVTAEEMRAEFAQQGRYTAGLATKYHRSRLIGGDDHQHLARGFEIGTRFHSAPVVRVADVREFELGHSHIADGRWRLYLFGGVQPAGLLDLASWLTDAAESPIARFTPPEADIDSVFDVHAVFRDDHHDIDLTELPEILHPCSGSLGLQDWEKVWAQSLTNNIFEQRAIDVGGALVVVRPDQYVAQVYPLSVRDDLTGFFDGILIEAD